jgi:hypothetical protein
MNSACKTRTEGTSYIPGTRLRTFGRPFAGCRKDTPCSFALATPRDSSLLTQRIRSTAMLQTTRRVSASRSASSSKSLTGPSSITSRPSRSTSCACQLRGSRRMRKSQWRRRAGIPLLFRVQACCRRRRRLLVIFLLDMYQLRTSIGHRHLLFRRATKPADFDANLHARDPLCLLHVRCVGAGPIRLALLLDFLALRSSLATALRELLQLLLLRDKLLLLLFQLPRRDGRTALWTP